jgi:hypothetical protein
VKGGEPPATWLPTSAQIVMAPERATLASLDANLQLAVRVLLAEHPSLGEGCVPGHEPEPPHLALAASIIVLATSLHEVITGYRVVAEQLFSDAGSHDDF